MKTIYKTLMTALLVVITTENFIAQNSNGQIKGIILDEQQNPAIGAEIKALQAGVQIKNAVADIDGKYTLKPLQPGTYEVLIMYNGYKTQRFAKVKVGTEETSYLDAELEINTLTEYTVVVEKEWNKSIVDKSYITMKKIDFDEISKMPVTKGDIKGMIANISSDILVNDDGLLYSRGSRVGSSKYFVDGDLLPFDTEVCGMAIQNLTVITGGIPAQFGDLTGAAVIVNTRDYFSGIAEKNIRNNNYKQKVAEEKKKAEYEQMKKEREKEIEEEKQNEK